MDWRQGLGCLLRDLGLCLRLITVLTIAWTGIRIFDNFTGYDKWWAFFPVMVGVLLTIAGTAAAILLLWQRVVRIKLDVAGRSAELSPANDERASGGAAS